MGMLVNSRTGECVALRASHVFGRNAARSDTPLNDPEVSLIHAVIRWREGRWFVADHSRNGSFLDGRALVRSEATPLMLGQMLRFGPDPHSSWQVTDVSAPRSLLLPADPGHEPILLAHHNLLPSIEAPELSLYEAEPGRWLIERQGELRPVADGETLDIAGNAYRLRVAEEIDDTKDSARARAADPPRLDFRLSLDEEHTWLQVRCGSQEADLGERSHHYCLVTLARKRLADAQAGFDLAAQGWLGSAELAKMLGVEVTHLNIQIYRARDQLMNALPTVPPLAHLVERRRGGLRLGAFGFEIRRGSRLEGSYAPAAASAPVATAS
jgi:hypothetical protein